MAKGLLVPCFEYIAADGADYAGDDVSEAMVARLGGELQGCQQDRPTRAREIGARGIGRYRELARGEHFAATRMRVGEGVDLDGGHFASRAFRKS